MDRQRISNPSYVGSNPTGETIKNQFDFLKNLLYNICIVNKKKKKINMRAWRNGLRSGLKIRTLRELWVRIPPPAPLKAQTANLLFFTSI